jgi:glycosyltransferase involved in cell wall biosynthesis
MPLLARGVPSRSPGAPNVNEKQVSHNTKIVRPAICIVSHNAFGAMMGGGAGHIGGVERQTSLTAKWLAAKGHVVSLVTWDEGQKPEQVVDGVRCISLCKADEGLAWLRFVHPRLTSLFKALARADADVYYHNCAEHYTGAIAWWCKRNGRAFVYSTAHDYDCRYDVPLPSVRKPHHKALYRYGLRRSSSLIVQTEYQRQLLQRELGLSSVALPMPCVGPSEAEFCPPAFPTELRVAWVGRLDPQKRLEWFLELAEHLPSIRFDIAAASDVVGAYRKGLKERATRISNIKWLGMVPREQMSGVYRGALCLCCTSLHEGFPNTFLEAWSVGTPLVTSFDADRIVERYRLGGTGNSVADLAVAIQTLALDRAAWVSASRNAREYFVERHSLNAAMPRFERVFVDASARGQ